MMNRFYGVYIKTAQISTILDIIRFLGEPDSIRFSHITLRGPYLSKMKSSRLRALNSMHQAKTVELVEPLGFFFNNQSTVSIRVNIGNLSELFYKPQFPNAIPHLTLYDGRSKQFATALLQLVSNYNWRTTLEVGPLQELTPKKKIDQEFLPLFSRFYHYYETLIGDPDSIPLVKEEPEDNRLALIQSVLERCLVPDNLIQSEFECMSLNYNSTFAA